MKSSICSTNILRNIQLSQPKDEVDYFDINVINNANDNIQDVWSLNPQCWEGNTGQWIQGRVQIEASGDPEYQVTPILPKILALYRIFILQMSV